MPYLPEYRQRTRLVVLFYNVSTCLPELCEFLVEHCLGRCRRRSPPTSTRVLASFSYLRVPRGAPRSQQLHSRKFRIALGGHLGQPSNSDLYLFSQSWRPHLGFRITYRSGYGVGFRVVQDLNTGVVELSWSTALLEVPLF